MKNANQHIRLTNEYFNAFTYDAMGNILTQQRHNRAGNQFDDLTYHYQKDANGNLERNRLYHVNDAISAGFDSTDIDDMGAFISAINEINTDNNYVYDKEGRLVKDRQEEIDTILWTVTGKVREIKRSDTSHKKNLKFNYDAFGRRIAKHVYNNETAMLEKSTYYILDAQGNQLSIYEHRIDTNSAKYYLAERNIYGSSRLGSANDTVNMFMPNILPSYGILGNRQYELSNHLGNVLTTISDVKYPLSSDNVSISGYEVGINGISDYSPFGAALDGRTVGKLGKRGFNSQERDNEVSGEGNSYTAEFWQYSPRLGRRWERDPIPQVFISDYSVLGNNPLINIDVLGSTVEPVTEKAKAELEKYGEEKTTNKKGKEKNNRDYEPAFGKIYKEWKNNEDIVVRFKTIDDNEDYIGTISYDGKNDNGQKLYSVLWNPNKTEELGASGIFEETYHLFEALEGKEMKFSESPNSGVIGLDIYDEVRAKMWVANNIESVEMTHKIGEDEYGYTHYGYIKKLNDRDVIKLNLMNGTENLFPIYRGTEGVGGKLGGSYIQDYRPFGFGGKYRNFNDEDVKP